MKQDFKTDNWNHCII